MKRVTLVALVFATVLFALPALSQTAASMYCDLRTGNCVAIHGSSLFTLPEVTITSMISKTDPNCPSAGPWFEAHFDINLKPNVPNDPAKTAYIVAEYQDTPSAWTIDIGDSPTDNGYGGNSGGPEHSAEVQVVDQLLSAYDEVKNVGVQRILAQQESLTNGSLKFEITNQILTAGQTPITLDTTVTQDMFWLPDPLGDTWLIHAAFNHVVDPGTDRKGCGVRGVTISIGNN